MESMLRERYGERCTEAHLRMALMPEGAAREVTREIRWPTLRMHNVWILPGVPEIFRMKLPVMVDFLRSKHPTGSFTSRAVYTQMDEGDLKPLLDDVVAKFPDVEVGSYPKWFDPTYKTKLTFDGLSQTQVLAARDFFVARLPPGEPQPIEDPRE
jgi:molybdopterin-biosynthesis enzyme MoeA-like protein